MKKITYFIVLLLVVNIAAAQQTGDFTNNITQLDQIQYLDAGINTFNFNTVTEGSQVFIMQQGDLNSATVNAIGSDIDISIIQNGNLNNANLQVENVSLSESILQNGNNNNVISYYFGYDQPVTSEVIQNGNNLTLERYGVNSYTDQIRVNMEGNSRTVIIRSY